MRFFYNHKGIECLLGSLSHYEIFIFYTFHILKVLLYTTKKKAYEVNIMADIDPKLGELIKKTRLERRLTQEEVAEMIGCHSQYYKNLENGKGMPSVPMFCKIMKALQVCLLLFCKSLRH